MTWRDLRPADSLVSKDPRWPSYAVVAVEASHRLDRLKLTFLNLSTGALYEEEIYEDATIAHFEIIKSAEGA